MLDEKMEMQKLDEAQEVARVKGRVERIVGLQCLGDCYA